jgi:pimeloyl-ACP methyl ester carboxylesterase
VDKLVDPDSRFIAVGDLQVHYKRAGEGQPVLVLLHGMGASVFSWREVMGPLAQSRTVIAFDRPGFGLTSRPMPGDWQGESPYSAQSQASLAVGLLDALGIEKAVLVGHSAGGSIAVLTALRFPERVSALILVSPAIYGSGGAPSWARHLLAIPHVRRWGRLFIRWLARRGESLLASAWHDPSRIQPEALAGYAKGWKVDNWDRALWEFALAGRPLGLEVQLDRLRVPTLVITGDDDRWVPTEQSVRLAREVPDAELVVLQACGHLAQEEQPAEFLTATDKFLGELPR